MMLTTAAREDLGSAMRALGFVGSVDFVSSCDDDEIAEMQGHVALCAEGLATWLVWFSDDTGTDGAISTYAYVDALTEEAACAEVKTWGITWATVVTQGGEDLAGRWELAGARRFYREARGDL